MVTSPFFEESPPHNRCGRALLRIYWEGCEFGTMAEYMLEAINITKKFPGVIANDNVCLNVKKGEILGLIGENGAGKSTILKVLNGIYPAGTYEGTIKIEGQEIKPMNSNDAMAAGIGFVPQEINVLKNFSVAENIYMSDLKLNKVDFEDVKKKKDKKGPFVNFKEMYRVTAELLEKNKINLDPRADVRKLSIGQQQMLMIARALASNPKILILDEPTTSLSNADVESLFEVVNHLKSLGTSVIFVTHKMEEILKLTDRVSILRDGKYISTFERENYDANAIIADMIGRQLTNLYPERHVEIGDVVFKAENVTIEHPYIANRNLVEDVSFEVRAGEVLGLSGLVGAGRSEVCMGIYGVTKIKSGKLYMNGKEIKINSTADAVANGIGLVSEDRKKYGLNFVWDIANNIGISNLNAVSSGPIVHGKKMSTRIMKYFDAMSVKANNPRVNVGTLSGGNQQKVVIGRTLNAEPKLLILDEPTKGIDVGSKNEIYQIINELAAEGIAIIMISSELPELMAMSDRYIVMAEGRVAGELSKGDASTAKIMELAVKTFKQV